jgi:hypothetical protein
MPLCAIRGIPSSPVVSDAPRATVQEVVAPTSLPRPGSTLAAYFAGSDVRAIGAGVRTRSRLGVDPGKSGCEIGVEGRAGCVKPKPGLDDDVDDPRTIVSFGADGLPFADSLTCDASAVEDAEPADIRREAFFFGDAIVAPLSGDTMSTGDGAKMAPVDGDAAPFAAGEFDDCFLFWR